MDSLLAGLSQHGYAVLFAIVFLESIGFLSLPRPRCSSPEQPAGEVT